jgi:hypothetical protein
MIKTSKIRIKECWHCYGEMETLRITLPRFEQNSKFILKNLTEFREYGLEGKGRGFLTGESRAYGTTKTWC